MSDVELRNFNTELQKMGETTCFNPQCNCLAILREGNVRSSVARYLTWFSQREPKYDTDMIVFEWYRYSSYVKKRGQGRLNYYRLPYIDDGTEAVPETVRNHVVCTWGMQSIMSYGRTSFGRIVKAAMYSSVLPLHKTTGETNYNSIDINDQKLEHLLRHCEYLNKLGEVRSIRVVSTFVDGMMNHHHRDNDTTSLNVTTSPYQWDIASVTGGTWHHWAIGQRQRIRANSRKAGTTVVKSTMVTSLAIYTTYYSKWKWDYPNLEVSRPAEDICNICYMFTHHHKFFADHTMRHSSDKDDDNNEQENKGGGEDPDVMDELACLTRRVDLNQPECASDQVAEEREQIMLDAAEHIKIARAQRKLYQQKVEDVKQIVDSE
jgi:hypothetical protein